MGFGELLLDSFWPQRCSLCDAPVRGASALHPRCLAALAVSAPRRATARALRDGPPLLAHFRDGPEFFRLLHEIKYGGRPRLLREVAAPLAARAREEGWLESGAVLVPLPDDPRRRAERGYSVTGLLAAELARGGGVRVDPTLLGRRPGGFAQARLRDAIERRRNQEERWVSGALDRQPTERALILIEDQITTGATACAALLRLGARGHRVACIALAHAFTAPGMLLT